MYYPAVLLLAVLPALVSAHGYLSSPPPRGIQKASYQVDDLKSPNHKGMCRGEPVGAITKVSSGGKITLGLTITAPHVGPCRVSILDANLGNERPIASKTDCAAPGKVAPWTIQLPSGLTGHHVLRWYWEAHHVSPPEPYEQCIDINFDGDGAPSDNSSAEPTFHAEAPPTAASFGQNQAPVGQAPDNSQPSPPPTYNAPPTPQAPSTGAGSSTGGSCTSGAYECTKDGGFNQCANGSWVKMGCSTGTQCQSTAQGSIVCA